ncbi:hypothetical protein LINPERHAP1_LOCUS12449 [Linum perenne]
MRRKQYLDQHRMISTEIRFNLFRLVHHDVHSFRIAIQMIDGESCSLAASRRNKNPLTQSNNQNQAAEKLYTVVVEKLHHCFLLPACSISSISFKESMKRVLNFVKREKKNRASEEQGLTMASTEMQKQR